MTDETRIDEKDAAVMETGVGPMLNSASSTSSSQRWQFVSTVGFAFAIVGLQLVQGILLARLLGPEGRGEYAAAVLYVQLLLYIGLFGGLEVICRYAAKDSVDRNGLRRAALWLGITTGVATCLAVLVLNLVALPTEKQYLIPIAVVCSLSIIGQHIMLVMTAVNRGSGDFGKYNLCRFIAASAFPILLVIAALVGNVEVITASWLFVLASLVSVAACVAGLPQPLTGTRKPKVPRLLMESRPYGLSMLATDLFERFDLLLVLWLAPLIEQGFYAAMVPAVYPLTVIPNTLGLFLFNAGASQKRRLSKGEIHRILGSTLAVQSVSTVVFMLLIGPLVVLLYGENFADAVVFALWLAPASAIRGILQGLDSYLKGRGRPLAPVRARILAIGAMLVTTWLLLDSFGTIAIAIAALVGQVICLIWLSAIVYADVGDGESQVACVS